MTYRDMTFCDGNGGKCQSFNGCFRALTDKVKEKAKKAELPISQFANAWAQECYVPPKEETK